MSQKLSSLLISYIDRENRASSILVQSFRSCAGIRISIFKTLAFSLLSCKLEEQSMPASEIQVFRGRDNSEVFSSGHPIAAG